MAAYRGFDIEVNDAVDGLEVSSPVSHITYECDTFNDAKAWVDAQIQNNMRKDPNLTELMDIRNVLTEGLDRINKLIQEKQQCS